MLYKHISYKHMVGGFCCVPGGFCGARWFLRCARWVVRYAWWFVRCARWVLLCARCACLRCAWCGVRCALGVSRLYQACAPCDSSRGARWGRVEQHASNAARSQFRLCCVDDPPPAHFSWPSRPALEDAAKPWGMPLRVETT